MLYNILCIARYFYKYISVIYFDRWETDYLLFFWPITTQKVVPKQIPSPTYRGRSLNADPSIAPTTIQTAIQTPMDCLTEEIFLFFIDRKSMKDLSFFKNSIHWTFNGYFWNWKHTETQMMGSFLQKPLFLFTQFDQNRCKNWDTPFL